MSAPIATNLRIAQFLVSLEVFTHVPPAFFRILIPQDYMPFLNLLANALARPVHPGLLMGVHLPGCFTAPAIQFFLPTRDAAFIGSSLSLILG